MRLRVLLEPNGGARYEQFRVMAVAVQDAALEGFFRSDHLLGVDPQQAYEATEAWTTLAGLARDTQRIRLGALVTASTFREPGILAAAVAVVDQMSGGRVDFALGAGWLAEEHAAFGLEFPDLRTRFERFEEQLDVITGLWETPPGKPFTYVGKHFRIANSNTRPHPAQSPRPPIIIGGTGARRTPLLAAKYADEFNLSFPAGLPQRLANFERICREYGRDPASLRKSVILPVACGQSRADVERRKATIDAPPLLAEVAAGSPQAVAERLAELRDQGVDTVYFHIYDINDVDHVHLLGSEVASRL